MRLAIELYGTVIGTLTGEARAFDFTPTQDGLDTFGTNSTVLSVTIPLAPAQRRAHAGRRRNWFAELLPEGDQYDYLLAQGGLRRDDTPSFLARFGRDVAGALQVWDLDDPTEPKTPSIRNLSPAEIRTLLEDPIGSPLANDPQSGRSSLGGVQPKIVLVRTRDGWAQALGGYPSTHILKPQLPGKQATVIYDEEYGSRLARRLRLADFEASIEEFDSLPAIVIERYDRADGGRLHQEDFSQALGASRNQKYQEIGGIVSLQRIADTLKAHATDPDLRRLARMVTLAVGIGNLDLHTKNLGLLHPGDGDITLAPAYDVVPQAHASGDGRLALAINGKYRHADITRDDLQAEFTAWGLRRAATTVNETLEELLTAVSEETPIDGAFPLLQEQLLTFVDNLRNGNPVGP
ncbi:HipA domain-containing protein [Propionicimonas sp.]|uniref:type II toxin-antitoxin system HipA family toxin n=1 Tax=Propionicimonas sp. TaxID=1955623 RepID=UPI0018044404|nr:HipA domain-containing protein [Propionicimonas sp.]MBU3976849.1 HipA domain-containing protein [Actinomycetota bacterium]MBA3019538.1 type II toxin-antitoxin system HipA family toxin [Propionicimonas sp.]MBU3986944.1 HipA domain-containing protein [Actinomycetota bacterium]MBU4006856.1 HipA domain-containing protein [Actinomycetota bacterium]MBU4065556.1 HipA domain-containing protein [Actinomycetota bacterium]